MVGIYNDTSPCTRLGLWSQGDNCDHFFSKVPSMYLSLVFYTSSEVWTLGQFPFLLEKGCGWRRSPLTNLSRERTNDRILNAPCWLYRWIHAKSGGYSPSSISDICVIFLIHFQCLKSFVSFALSLIDYTVYIYRSWHMEQALTLL